MERGYLLAMVSVGLIATSLFHIPFLSNFPISIPFIGYIVISRAIREMRASTNELNQALKFAYITIFINVFLSLIGNMIYHGIIPGGRFAAIIMFYAPVILLFFCLGIFFWIFKAEYMWSPRKDTRLDFMIFSGLALPLFLINLFLLPIFWHLIPFGFAGTLLQLSQFLNIARIVFTLFVFYKLYNNAKNATQRRWP